MIMRVSKLGRQQIRLGKQQIRPVNFWIAVGVTSVLLTGIIGIPIMQTGHVPATPHWMTAALVAYAWGISAWVIVRQGRSALQLQWVAGLVGMTLFFGSDLLPSLGRASWIKDVGCLLFVGSILSQWVEFGKRRPASPDDASSDQAEDLRGTP